MAGRDRELDEGGKNRRAWRTCVVCRDRSVPPGKLRCESCHHVNSGIAILEGTRMAGGLHGVVSLAEVTSEDVPRYSVGILDLLFGSAKKPGIACTSVNVFAAVWGFGKSTLMLQTMSAIATSTGKRPLFVGAEQSAEEVREVAHRLQLPNLDRLLIIPLEAQQAGAQVTPELLAHYDPPLVVIDSQQAYSEDQEDGVELIKSVKPLAVARKCAFIVICQLTKEGTPEGNNRGLHAGDCVLMGEKLDVIVDDDGVEHLPRKLADGRVEPFRALRSEKNRFAPSNEIFFEMTELGLVPWKKPGKKAKKEV